MLLRLFAWGGGGWEGAEEQQSLMSSSGWVELSWGNPERAHPLDRGPGEEQGREGTRRRDLCAESSHREKRSDNKLKSCWGFWLFW